MHSSKGLCEIFFSIFVSTNLIFLDFSKKFFNFTLFSKVILTNVDFTILTPNFSFSLFIKYPLLDVKFLFIFSTSQNIYLSSVISTF